MSQPERCEMLVLGRGAGGKLLAWQMAKSGHRSAVVERKLIGGSCPNTNCLPSENEIWSAKIADLVHHADRSEWRRVPSPGPSTSVPDELQLQNPGPGRANDHSANIGQPSG